MRWGLGDGVAGGKKQQLPDADDSLISLERWGL
jgi:hypothetical protein